MLSRHGNIKGNKPVLLLTAYPNSIFDFIHAKILEYDF